jgi:hypothetical protein
MLTLFFFDQKYSIPRVLFFGELPIASRGSDITHEGDRRTESEIRKQALF